MEDIISKIEVFYFKSMKMLQKQSNFPRSFLNRTTGMYDELSIRLVIKKLDGIVKEVTYQPMPNVACCKGGSHFPSGESKGFPKTVCS